MLFLPVVGSAKELFLPLDIFGANWPCVKLNERKADVSEERENKM